MPTNKEPINADQFIAEFRRNLSSLVTVDRTVLARYSAGLAPGPGRGYVTVNFINLPEFRHNQNRGGGAESENNRQCFIIRGFNATSDSPVERVKVEQLINHVGPISELAPNMRAKSASPAKVAQYLASYINGVASAFQPHYTHD